MVQELFDFATAIEQFIAAMPEAHKVFGEAYCRGSKITHLKEVTTQRQLVMGEKSYAHMRRAADTLGIPVRLTLFPQKAQLGSTDRKGRIRLRKTLSPPHMGNVGIHELTHAYFHYNPHQGRWGRQSQQQEWEREYEAELTAYLWSYYFLVDTVDSPLYIAMNHGRIRDITAIANRASAYAWLLISAGQTEAQTETETETEGEE